MQGTRAITDALIVVDDQQGAAHSPPNASRTQRPIAS